MPLPETAINAPAALPVPEGLRGVIINDCRDPNAAARQRVRFGSLFGIDPTFIGLGDADPGIEASGADLEAGGQLVDILQASATPEGYPNTPTVVLVNVAPRGNDVKKKWENGTPFCYTTVDDTVIFTAYEGRTLPFLHKLGLAEEVELMDIPEVTASWAERGIVSEEEAESIRRTQFRSLEYLPLAAREILGGRELPSQTLPVEGSSAINGLAWFVDNFGNVKTTLLPEDVDFEEGRTVTLEDGREITCYTQLANVPTGEFGLTIGSSGHGRHRWLEVVQQKGRAADELEIGVGSRILATEAALQVVD